MPNTGKPSPNCHLCRQRRVKCDLGRPGCRRCIKYGVECPGYRDDEDLRFQRSDVASFAKQEKKKRPLRLPMKSALQVVPLTPPDSSVGSSRASSASPLPLLRGLRQHWAAESVPLLLSCYSSLDFLPGLFRGLPEDHCLVRAGQVFARAYIINRFRPDTDPRELSDYLGKALSSVSAAVQNPKSYTSDSTVAAVWLLGNYEVLMGGFERRSFITWKERPLSPSPSWYIHSNGLLSLLRARGDRQLYSRSGRQIFWVMHNIIQVRCATTNSACPSDFGRWFKIVEDTIQPGEALLLETGRYMASACSLLSKLMPIVRGGNVLEACARYEELLTECDTAELTILMWMQSAPQDHIEPGPVHGYFWNSWRSARIKLHHMLILATNLAEHAPNCPFHPEMLQARRNLCLDIISTTARDVVDSIPKSSSMSSGMSGSDPRSPAGYFDAIRLIWPLSHLYVIPTVPRHLRIIARETLSRIGREGGILAALQPRPGGMNFPPEALAGLPIDDLRE